MVMTAFCKGLLKALFGGTLIAAAALAQASVTLESSVQKVEKFVDDAGVVQRRLVAADAVVPGDELRYTITFKNAGADAVDAGSIVITNPIPDSTVYLDGTAFGSGTEIVFSADAGQTFATADAVTDQDAEPAAPSDFSTIRWVFQPELQPGEQSYVSFNVRLK